MGPTGLCGHEGSEKGEKQDKKLIAGRLRRPYTLCGRGAPPLRDSLPIKVDYGNCRCLLAVLWEYGTTHCYSFSLSFFFLRFCHYSSREMEPGVHHLYPRFIFQACLFGSGVPWRCKQDKLLTNFCVYPADLLLHLLATTQSSSSPSLVISCVIPSRERRERRDGGSLSSSSHGLSSQSHGGCGRLEVFFNFDIFQRWNISLMAL